MCAMIKKASARVAVRNACAISTPKTRRLSTQIVFECLYVWPTSNTVQCLVVLLCTMLFRACVATSSMRRRTVKFGVIRATVDFSICYPDRLGHEPNYRLMAFPPVSTEPKDVEAREVRIRRMQRLERSEQNFPSNSWPRLQENGGMEPDSFVTCIASMQWLMLNCSLMKFITNKKNEINSQKFFPRYIVYIFISSCSSVYFFLQIS